MQTPRKTLSPLRVSLVAAILLAASTTRGDDVPPPSATPCEVIVNGRTSTLKSIVIKKVGQNVPKIYHVKHTCGNTPGFDWYVSQHYALRGNVGDQLAREFLVLAELAYPHYVEIIGSEPPDIETTRLTITHATDLDELQKAVKSDLGMPWVGGGGGVTLPASFASYCFPSGGLRYHRNDLSLHEALHLQQFAVAGPSCAPLRFLEGITHTFGNHVYDPKKQQLTVCVFDKAPVNNPIEQDLKLIRQKGVPTIQEMIRDQSHYVLYTHFFWSDPERLMKWRIWRDELFRANLKGDALAKFDLDTMKQLHGDSLEDLNRQWQAWVRQRHSTFTWVDWGWEQWGETLQSYGYPNKGRYAQMDLNCPTGQRLKPDPFRMDYPRGPKSHLVGHVELGAEEPSVGCLVGFKLSANQGYAGIGLGVEGQDLLQVCIDRNRRLLIDGTSQRFSGGCKAFEFPAEFKRVARETGEVGMTVKIAKAAIEVVLQTGPGGAVQEMKAAYPIESDDREDILNRTMALFSRNGRHEMTPYLEDEPPPSADLGQPAPANPWRFAGDRETYRVYRAAWRMGRNAPASLVALRDAMVHAMDKDPTGQRAALDRYRQQIAGVRDALRRASDPNAAAALAELDGAKKQE